MRERDVFRFKYNEAYLDKWSYWDHCFDGKLVAFSSGESFLLFDTYWMHRPFTDRPSSGRRFTPKEAAERGELKFICNLNEVDIIDEHMISYYADEDVFNLSYQHGHCRFFAIRKGAPRSSERMLLALREKEKEIRSEMEYGASHLQRIAVARQRIQDGFIDDTWLPL